MGVRISSQENKVCLFDSTTNWAFGPVFHTEHDAASFLDSLEDDARTYTAKRLEKLYISWYNKEYANADGV